MSARIHNINIDVERFNRLLCVPVNELNWIFALSPDKRTRTDPNRPQSQCQSQSCCCCWQWHCWCRFLFQLQLQFQFPTGQPVGSRCCSVGFALFWSLQDCHIWRGRSSAQRASDPSKRHIELQIATIFIKIIMHLPGAKICIDVRLYFRSVCRARHACLRVCASVCVCNCLIAAWSSMWVRYA